MTAADTLDMTQLAIWTLLICGGPAVCAAMGAGLVIALAQALTQVQEATLTFVPKMLAVIGALALSATFIGSQFQVFTETTYEKIAIGFGTAGR